MFDFVGGQRVLSTGYVKELHAALLRNQETHSVVDEFGQAFEKRLDRGAYKTSPNSPTRPDGAAHEFCPPEHVASEMDRLIHMHAEHARRGIPPEVEAAWLHHRFAQIHPFADGNGRVARALASLIFVKANLFPLVVKRDDWSRYIDALENADGGELRPLVNLFVEAQRTALLDSTEIALEAVPVTTAEGAILAVRDRLMHRGRLSQPEWLVSKSTAAELAGLTLRRFGEVASQLNGQVASLGSGFSFDANDQEGQLPDGPRVAMTTEQGHTADFDEYSRVVNLILQAGSPDRLVLSFHALGPRFCGLVGVVAYLVQGIQPKLLSEGAFQINYEESLESAKTRFCNWLERVIVAGLDQWRRTL
jgi:hypothetical protein